jgi:hypothetical protein
VVHTMTGEVLDFYPRNLVGFSKDGVYEICHGSNVVQNLAYAGTHSRRLSNLKVTVFYSQKVTNCILRVTK